MKPTYEELEAQVKQLAAENAALKSANGVALKILNDEETIVTSLWASSIQEVEVETPATDAILASLRAEGTANAIPEGYVLVPQQMFIDADGIEAICSQCGNGDENQYGEYTDGLLWVGDIQDDDGKVVHGLHISSADYSEEGGLTIYQFEQVKGVQS